MSGARIASHAGSWYTRDSKRLASELDTWLAQVPDKINDSDVPIKGARVIIAPHAGYSYSGPCAAWAYKALDLGRAKCVFVLGPSHTYYLSGCALTTYATYATPLGDLRVDLETITALGNTGRFSDIPRQRDEDEHSLEMHLPYLAKRLAQTYGDQDRSAWPPIVPILVGNNGRSAEKEFGQLLLPYLRDPDNAFIVSSDFCHWGSRFGYTAYTPDGSEAAVRSLSRRDAASSQLPVPIHESISKLDHLAMDAIESGSHDALVDNLKATGNTVCGRHPIGVVMAALEALRKERAGSGSGSGVKGDGVFTFVKYDRSSLVEELSDSSVSYAAAYAII